jgi:uncharacterized protein (DUF58 family)
VRFLGPRYGTALAGLTVRGRSFLAAGTASIGCAFALGQQDLLRAAVLLVSLPLGCAAVLSRVRYDLALTRAITPCRVVAGATATVTLDLQNLSPRATRILLAEDRVPHALGPAPRFLLTGLRGGRRASVTYSLRSELRGRYPVGPLRLRLADPFGMCEVIRSFTAVDCLLVAPRTWPLLPLTTGGAREGSGESPSLALATAGEDDVSIREYRNGDDLRRVHWRSTARRGQLMVRQEEQSRPTRATVLLDVRACAHRGERACDSFEWAVTAAASVAVHLSEHQHEVRLLTDGNPAPWAPPCQGAGRLVDGLVVLRTGPDESLASAAAVAVGESGRQILVAVLGELDRASACLLGTPGAFARTGIAVLLRVEEWTVSRPEEDGRIPRERAAAVRELRTRGWTVVEAGPDEQIDQVWERAVLSRSAPSSLTAGWR